ncbi:histidine phosphatase family protein [Brevundimonas sp. VNH65]|uniref:histidine phosphatase family protein n=1 Tax=Brevundimonas sp. VNH65 TaxID=3400917 RepID=UPI003C073DDF
MTVPASDLAQDQPVTASGRPGAITLTRHGKPALSRKCLLTAQGYGRWWAEYERLGLFPGQSAPAALADAAQRADLLISSTRPRARESADLAAPGRDVRVDPLFIEAALPPPPVPEWIKLSPRFWGVVSRFWWHVFNHHDGQETRAQAEARAGQAADFLIDAAAGGRDVVVFAHGYFNHMVGVRLKARGWRLAENQGFKYWSQRRFEAG